MGAQMCWRCAALAAAGTCIAEAASGGGSSGSSSGVGAGEGSHSAVWWNQDYEYLHLESYIVCGLVWLAMLFDVAHHKLEHLAMNAAISSAAEEEDEIEHEVHRESQVPQWESLMNRCTGELMVLGFLAFVVWCANRAGAFERIAKDLSGFKSIKLPLDGAGYLHAVEDIHMQLFISMMVYVLMLSLAVKGTSLAARHWSAANECLIHAWSQGHLACCEEQDVERWLDSQPDYLKDFFKTRSLFFSSLEAYRPRWRALRKQLNPVLAKLPTPARFASQNGELASEIVDRTVPSLLEDWFPFDQYLELQCRYLVDNLTEIKATTWGFLSIAQLVKAQFLRETKAEWWAYMWLILLAFSLLIFATFSVFKLYCQEDMEAAEHQLGHSPSSCSSSRGSRRASLIENVTGPINRFVSRFSGAQRHIQSTISGQLEDHTNYPWMAALRFLQFLLFTCCLNVTRFVIAKYWWEEFTARAISCALLVALGVPVLGIVLGFVLPRLSMKLARASLMDDHHVRWLSVIIEDHVAEKRWSSERRRMFLNGRTQKADFLQQEAPTQVGDTDCCVETLTEIVPVEGFEPAMACRVEQDRDGGFNPDCQFNAPGEVLQ